MASSRVIFSEITNNTKLHAVEEIEEIVLIALSISLSLFHFISTYVVNKRMYVLVCVS